MFKVGDKVTLTDNYMSADDIRSGVGNEWVKEDGSIVFGDTYTVKVCDEYDTTIKIDSEEGFWLNANQFKLAGWQPTPGELVEMRDEDFDIWFKKVFVTEYKGKFISEGGDDSYYHYDEIRQLKKTHTMILDGEETEISEEVYQQLKAK